MAWILKLWNRTGQQKPQTPGVARSGTLRNVWIERLILSVCCAVFFFVGLSRFGLTGPDEPTYSRSAQEMLHSGDWITPTLYGETWIDKPPLVQWTMAASFAIFGEKDWAARLPSALFATMLVFVGYSVLRKVRRASAFPFALMLASSAGILGFAHGASTDMMLGSAVSISLLFWYAWYVMGQRRWLYAAYAALAIATLAKGPVAVVLVAVPIGVFLLIQRDWVRLRQSISILPLLLYAVMVLPWFIAMQLAHPEFFQTFFVDNNLRRFATNRYHHTQPFWYFLPVIVLIVMPWTVYAIRGLATAFKQLLRKTERKPIWLFALLWCAVPMVFFSFSQSKLPGYILPAAPGALLAAALALESIERIPQWVRLCHATMLGIIVGGAVIAPILIQRQEVFLSGILVAAIVGCFVAATAYKLATRFGSRGTAIASTVFMALTVVYLLGTTGHYFNQTASARPVSKLIQTRTLQSLPLAVYQLDRGTERGLSFYLNRTPVHVEYNKRILPKKKHVLVIRARDTSKLHMVVHGRKIRHIGSFPPQHIELYVVR